MAHQFTFTHCNNPNDPGAIDRRDQMQASKTFQQYKRVMKAQNDTEEGPHMIEIGVTDAEGRKVDGYKHKCKCTYPY